MPSIKFPQNDQELDSAITEMESMNAPREKIREMVQMYDKKQASTPTQPVESIAELPKEAVVPSAAPLAPVKVSPEEIQRTGKLPEGVSPEQATEAIATQQVKEGAPVLEQVDRTVMDEVKLKLTEAGEKMSPQQEFVLKEVMPFAVGMGGASLATKLATKFLPKITMSILGRLGLAGVEGAAFVGAEEAAKGELATPAELATGAATFGAFTGVGEAAKGVWKAATQKLPSKLVASSLKLTPSQKKKISQIRVAGEPAEDFLLRNQITGSREEIAAKLKVSARTSRKELDEGLAKLTDVFQNKRVDQGLELLVKDLNQIGLESEVLRVNTLLAKSQKEGLTLTEINEVKRTLDSFEKIFPSTTAESAKVKGLQTLRRDIKNFVEKEATNLGFTGVKELNKNTQITTEIGKAIESRIEAQASNNILSLTDVITGVGGFGVGTKTDDPTSGLLFAAGLVGAKKVLGSSKFKTALAKKLSSLKIIERTSLAAFLNGGEELSPELKKKVVILIKGAITPDLE